MTGTRKVTRVTILVVLAVMAFAMTGAALQNSINDLAGTWYGTTPNPLNPAEVIPWMGSYSETSGNSGTCVIEVMDHPASYGVWEKTGNGTFAQTIISYQPSDLGLCALLGLDGNMLVVKENTTITLTDRDTMAVAGTAYVYCGTLGQVPPDPLDPEVPGVPLMSTSASGKRMHVEAP